MAKADALFLLIKSLTTSEKALVRQGDKAQPGYLALFDFMNKQVTYEERKAKKKLLQLGHDINFAYAKNYLTRHILRVLREYEDAGQLAVTRQVLEIELLMRRRVYELAEKMLLKARERAWAEERWHDFLQLSNTEMALLMEAVGDLDQNLAHIDRLNAERAEARAMLLNLGAFEDLYHRYRPVLKRKQNARNEWDISLVEQFAKHSLLSASTQAQSIRARRVFYMCQSMIHAYIGNYDAAHDALRDSIGLYEAHSFLRDDHPDGYLNDLWRLGGHHLYAGKHAEVEQTLVLLKQARERHGLHSADIFEKYTRLLLSYALTTRNYAMVEAELAQINEGLAVFADSIAWSSQSVLQLLLGRLHLELGRHREAKGYLNQILDHPARNQREDMTSLARIMLIFIYWEQGDADLAESSSRATRKYLQRRDALYQFERRILRFLEQHSFHDSGPELLKALQQLHKDLLGIFADPLEANILAFFDIMAWLDVRIKGLQKG
jgi:hypothetical protein